MTYRYPLDPKPPRTPLGRMAAVSDEGEQLTGIVHGKKASDLEERWAGAEDRAERSFIFQYFVETPFTLPGKERQIDFMDTEEVWQPIEIDGTFTHKSGAQKAQDKMRDAIINQELQKHGILPIIRIPGIAIPTPDDADRVLREIFGG